MKRLARNQWDRLGAWALTLVGAGLLVFGWIGASDTPYPAEQIPFVISGGLGGIFCLGIAVALWLSADLRDEWSQLRRIEDQLAAAAQAPPAAVPTGSPSDGSPAPNGSSTTRPKRAPGRRLKATP